MRPLALAATALLVAACLGTKDPYNPGTPLGTYAVSGAMAMNACGGGLGATNPWAFDVKLSEDGTTLYWIQGGPPISGTLDARRHATMSSSSSQMIHDANPRAGVGACTIVRADALDMTLAADSSSFTGTLEYTFGPSAGSDCADQLSAAGGPYAAFPCNVRYTLTGTRSSSTATK